MGIPVALLFRPLSIGNIWPSPTSCFEIEGELENVGENRVSVLALWTEVRAANTQLVVHPGGNVNVPNTQILPRMTTSVRIPVSASAAMLRRLNESRSDDGSLELSFSMRATAARVMDVPPGQWPLLGLPMDIVAANLSSRWRVVRDDWLKLLAAIGHDELEVFELRARTLRDHPVLAKALTSVRRAEKHYRDRNWEETLAACGSAFEAAATSLDERGVRQGFDELWRRMLPTEAAEPKREALNSFVQKLRDFMQLGRHTRPPFPPVDEQDALLALRITLSLFEYIGLRLDRNPSSQ